MDSTQRLPASRELALFALIALLVFGAAAWSAEFLNQDDVFFFGPQNAEFVHGGLAHVLDPTRTIANAYLPVSHASLYLDWRLFAAAPRGPHLHSLALHVLVAFFLARLFGRFGFGRLAAFAGAATFLLHPALTESAMWVAGRKDLLSGLFGVLTLSAAWRARHGEAAQRSWSLLWCALALYSKGSAIVLPLLAAPLLLSVRLAPRPRLPWTFAALTAITALAGAHHALLAAGEGTLVEGQFGARLGQVPGVFWHYAATTIWPSELNAWYPALDTFDVFRANLVLGIALLVGLAAAAVWAWRSDRRWTAVGIGCWVLALAPFNTALPASTAAAADRYLYLAIPGLALAVLGLGPRLGVALAACLALVFGVATKDRAADFRSSEALWRASLEEEPRNALAAFNLAEDLLRRRPDAIGEIESLLERTVESARYPHHRLRAEALLGGLARSGGRFEVAVGHFENALAALDEIPASAVPPRLRVELLLDGARTARMGGRLDAAQRLLSNALALAPDEPVVLAFAASAKLGEHVDGSGRVPADDPAVETVRAMLDRAADRAAATRRASGDSVDAVDDDSGVYEVELARGELASALGRSTTAHSYFDRAMRIDPRLADAHIGKAQVFLGRGLFAGAEQAVRDGLAAGVQDPRLYYLLGLALAGQNQFEQARTYFENYLRSRPQDAAVRTALAAVLTSQAMRDLYRMQPTELATAVERIASLDPLQPKLLILQAVLHRHRRELQDALVRLEQARALMPGDAEVERLYVEALRDRGYECLLSEDRRGAAMDYFRRFIEAAPATGVATESVANLIEQEWLRHIEAGRDALLRDELDVAERAFVRAKELRPDDSLARLQLGFVHFQRGGDDALVLALDEFRAHARHCRELGRDPTLAVLYEVQTLGRLGRLDTAVEVADACLAAPAASATDADVARLRAARDAVAQRLGR